MVEPYAPTRRLPWLAALSAALPVSLLQGCLKDAGTSTLLSGVVDPGSSVVVARPAFGIAADGQSVSVIQIRLRDAAGAPLANRAVEGSVHGASAFLGTPRLVTNAAGLATTTLAAHQAGRATVTFTVNSGPEQTVLPLEVAVNFVWGVPQTYFVSPTGADTPDCSGGTSPATAWRTLAKAVQCAQPGDTIYVGAGNYAESLALELVGTVAQPIRLIADTRGAFTGEPGEVIVDGTLAPFVFRLDGCEHVTLDGFTIRGALASGGEAGGVVVRGSSNTIRNCSIYECANGVLLIGGDGNVLEDNRISSNAHLEGNGVIVDGSAGCRISNNLIYGNASNGLLVIGAAEGLLVRNNTLLANAGDQLRVEGAGNSVIARDNILASGGAAGMILEHSGAPGLAGDSPSVLDTDFNLVWDHPLGNWAGLAPGPDDLSVDPLLLDPDGADGLLGGRYGADDDFHLDEATPSPAIDAGSASADSLVLANGAPLAERTTREDGGLDGSEPDGEKVNLGFHYPAIHASLEPLAFGDARIIYGLSGQRQPRTRRWNNESERWTPVQLAPPASSSIAWIVNTASRPDSAEEFFGILSVHGAGTELDLLTWTGRDWSVDWTATGISPDQAAKRGFDLAHESNTGDLLVVHADGGRTPLFRTRSHGVWSAPQRLPLNDGPAGPAPDLNYGEVLWVELEPMPGTNRIALAYADSDATLVALVWDGTAWLSDTAALLEPTLAGKGEDGVVNNRAFDLAYEHETGDLLVAWGRSASPGFWWSELKSASYAWSAPQNESSAPANGAPHFVDLGSQIHGRRVAGAFYKMDGVETLGLGIWDGAQWAVAETVDGQVRNYDQSGAGDMPAAVAWSGMDQAVCVYADKNQRRMDWATWTSPSGWVVQSDFSIERKRLTESVLLRAFPDGNRLLAMLSDSRSRLYALGYNGIGWTLLHSSRKASLEKNLSSLKAMPFGLAFQAP